MLTSGKFGICSHRIDVGSATKPVKLFPVGDFHYGSPAFCDETFNRFRKYTKKQQNKFQCLYLLMGDEIEFFSTSERSTLRSAKLHDTTLQDIEEAALSRLKAFHRKLSYMSEENGQVIGVLDGNHSYTFKDGETTSEKLANLFDAPYLGVCALIRLSIERHGAKKTFDIAAHHGRGAGKRRGASLNALEDMQLIFQADMYLQGHNHDKCAIPGRPLQYLQTNKHTGELELQERKIYLGRTGSFTRAYRPGEADYNVDVLRTSSPLGWIEFELRYKRPTKVNESQSSFIEVRGISHE